MIPSDNLEKKIPSEACWKAQLISVKVKVFRIVTGFQPGHDTFEESRSVISFLTNMRVTGILCSFRLVKDSKEELESSRLVFLEKIPVNITGDNTSGPKNGGGIADLVSLRTLLAICQKSQELSSWEVIDSFIILAQESLRAAGNHFCFFKFYFEK